jgi:hypothetical protein
MASDASPRVSRKSKRVVNRAWMERILTIVFVERHAPHRPEEIVLHSPPRPLTH